MRSDFSQKSVEFQLRLCGVLNSPSRTHYVIMICVINIAIFGVSIVSIYEGIVIYLRSALFIGKDRSARLLKDLHVRGHNTHVGVLEAWVKPSAHGRVSFMLRKTRHLFGFDGEARSALFGFDGEFRSALFLGFGGEFRPALVLGFGGEVRPAPGAAPGAGYSPAPRAAKRPRALPRSPA